MEKQFIAYFDILGYKNDINNKNREIELLYTINGTIILLKNALKNFKKYNDKIDIKLKVFSDNFLLCTKKDYRVLLEVVASVQAGLFHTNTSIRGALCYDELVFSKDFVFGKGLINVHYIENTIAIFPRILFDNSFLAGIENINDQGSLNIYPIENYYRIDFDNNKYLDYINIMKKYEAFGLIDFIELLNTHVNYIKDKLGSNDKRIEQNTHWIKNYHNSYCLENNLTEFIVEDEKQKMDKGC